MTGTWTLVCYNHDSAQTAGGGGGKAFEKQANRLWSFWVRRREEKQQGTLEEVQIHLIHSLRGGDVRRPPLV